ncbi:hypothetical protein [Absidia glauca]|uniref:Uncharacterized protein n=1 Tax=Absidia glauca TaxID=4829 RepID=A0A163K5P7_ABSGL|nr:hypothetical protein [Absidia glauca]
MDDIQGQYNRAFRYFLLTKNEQAATTCVKALNKLSALPQHPPIDSLSAMQLQLQLLYINIASMTLSTTTTPTPQLAKRFGLSTCPLLLDQFCLAIWQRLDDTTGSCDPRLVNAYLLLTLKLSIPTAGRKVAEAWLATLPLDSSSVDRQTGWTTFYLQVVKIYATRILPECDELDSARSVVETNSTLSHENKEAFLHLIQLFEEDQLRRRRIRWEQQQKETAKARQEQKARKKKEAALKRRQRLERSATKPVAQPESQKVPDQTLVKTWIHHLKVTGSVALMVVLFALLGLLKGPRGYLTDGLRTIMTKLWRTANMGTKVTNI